MIVIRLFIMGNKIKQHYIPQFLLRRFAIDKNQPKDKQEIYCLDLKNKKINSDRINNLAQEDSFYDIDLDKYYYSDEYNVRPIIDDIIIKYCDKKYFELCDQEKISIKNCVENLLSERVEDPLARKIIKIKNNSKKNFFIDDDDKKHLSDLIAVQFLRTRAYRDALEQKLIRKEQLKLLFQGIDISKIKISFSDEQLRWFHLKDILNGNLVYKYSTDLYRREWILVFNHTKTPFIINDDPILQFENCFGGKLPKYVKDNNEKSLAFVIDETMVIFCLPTVTQKGVYDKKILHIYDENKIQQFDTVIALLGQNYIYGSNLELLQKIILDMNNYDCYFDGFNKIFSQSNAKSEN